MNENDQKPAPETPEVVTKADLEALRAEQARASRELAEKVGQIGGQMASLGAYQPPQPFNREEEPPIDIVGDTEKALDQHFQKRAGPIIASQIQNAVTTQKELLSLKRADDWKEYGPQVEALIKENRIQDGTLSVPGTYEQLLDLVKSRHVDAIAEKKAQALFEAHKAKQATSGAPAGGATPPPGASKTDPEFTEKELFVLKKLKVDPKRAAEVSKTTEYDGIRMTGEVTH